MSWASGAFEGTQEGGRRPREEGKRLEEQGFGGTRGWEEATTACMYLLMHICAQIHTHLCPCILHSS